MTNLTAKEINAKKAELNKALKAIGMGRVKVIDNSVSGEKTYRENGKMLNGLKGGHVGPLTVTDAHRRTSDDVWARILKVIINQNLKHTIHGDMVKIELGSTSRKTYTMSISKEWLPTYSRSMNYDHGYKTTWFVVS